eukprot:CFRG0550T1
MKAAYAYGQIRVGETVNVLSRHNEWTLCIDDDNNVFRMPRGYLVRLTQPPVPKFTPEEIIEYMNSEAVDAFGREYLTGQMQKMLRSILTHSDFPSVKIEGVDCLSAFQSAMLHFPSHRDINVVALCGLMKLCLDDDIKRRAGEKFVHLDIQKAMVRFPTDTAVQKKACLALCNFCVNEDNNGKAGDVNIHLDIQRAMLQFPLDPDVQRAACDALSNFCDNDDNNVKAGEAGILVDINRLMVNFPNDATVQQKCCAVLWNFCDSESNKVKAGEKNIHLNIQKAMLRFPTDGILQKEACGALMNFCSRKKMGGLDKNLITEVIIQSPLSPSGHIDNCPVAKYFKHSSTSNNDAGDGNTDIIGTIESIKTSSPVHTGGLSCCCGPLFSLFNVCDENQKKAGESDIHFEIQRAMVQFPCDVGVQRNACSALSNFCLRNDDNQRKAGYAGLEVDIERAIAQFPNDEVVQDKGHDLLSMLVEPVPLGGVLTTHAPTLKRIRLAH